MKNKKTLMAALCLIIALAGIGCGIFFTGCTKKDNPQNIPGQTPNEGEQKVSDFPEMAPNGYVVYFNPVTGKVCTEEDYNANIGASNTGTKSGCMKWYVFNDDGGDTVNLLLDHNTTATVAWGSNPDKPDGQPDMVNGQLAQDVAGWANDIKATARLITANEIAQATGNIDFDSAKEGMEPFDFDLNTDLWIDSISPYGWLYDRTNIFCTNNGAYSDATPDDWGIMEGYWTSSPVIEKNELAWGVYFDGTLNGIPKMLYDTYGIRPIINVSREKF